MAIKCEDYNSICVLTLAGDLSGETTKELSRLTEEQIEQKQVAAFAIDFEKAGFVDSEGLEALLALRQRCEELFGQLRLASLDDNVKKILQITRLEHLFDCHPDLPAALKTMR